MAAKRKHNDYHVYDGKTRCKIAKYSEEHGIVRGARLLENKLGHRILMSTVQSIRDAYWIRVAVVKNPNVV